MCTGTRRASRQKILALTVGATHKMSDELTVGRRWVNKKPKNWISL